MKGLRIVWTLALLGLVSGAASAQENLAFAGADWEVAGEARVVSRDGREVLQLRTGRVAFPGADFGNGSIEFDFRTTGHRSFAGLGFRVEASGRDFEYFYIRPHQTGRFDAMQYTPVHSGLSAWQIYAEHNAAADFQAGDWVHVRLEVDELQLRVFVDGAGEPALTVDSMVRNPLSGGLVLVANFPEQNDFDIYPTEFANLRIRRTGVPTLTEAPDLGNGGPPMIQRWDVSQAFAAPAETITSLPDTATSGEWESIWTNDRSGRLDIGRNRARLPGDHGTTVLVRSVIRSDRNQVKKLNFGFSDRGSVFLNGRLLFTGDNSYLSRSERYLGVMTVDNDALYLPLVEGDNDLVIAVSEVFGGWGVVAKLDNLDGVEVSRTTP